MAALRFAAPLALLLGACAGFELRQETVAIPDSSNTLELVTMTGAKVGDRELLPFSIARHEMTWQIFTQFYEGDDLKDVDTVARPSKGKSFLGQVGLKASFEEMNKPAISLHWLSGVAYCEWLSRKTGDYYRLPTEAEWEFAARGGREGKAPADLDAEAWTKANSKEETYPPAQLKANPYGLYDMLGNTWEYCLEHLEPPHYSPVARGGAWNTGPDRANFVHRQPVEKSWYEPEPNRPRSVWWLSGRFNQGFRVVRVAGAEDAKEREAYRKKIKITFKKNAEHVHKLEADNPFFMHLTGTVTNTGDRTLSELEIMAFYVKPNGKPHLWDIIGADKPFRGTLSKTWPVMANAHGEGEIRRPLGPGESRDFALDIPYSFDDEPDVVPDKFDFRCTNLRFAK